MSKGKKGNTPCRNMDVLSTWTEGEALSDKNCTSGDITLPRADQNKDKPLLPAEDERHRTHSSFEKRDL